MLPLFRPKAKAELSTSREVSAPGVPLKLAAGRKRTLVAAARNRPEPSVSDVAMVVQVGPLSHCQLPWSEFAALVVMTTPNRELAAEPPLTVSVLSEKRAKKRLVTLSPAGARLSSLTAKRIEEPVVTGASLTALTVKVTPWLERVLTFGEVLEPLSITSKLMLPLPLAFATVL